MGHPLIDEFCRVHGVAHCRPEFFNRCQSVFKLEVQPKLDDYDRLVEENLSLKAELKQLQERASRRRAEAVTT